MFRLAMAALISAFTFAASPALAVCNPGSPHCIQVQRGSLLEKLKNKLKNPGTLGSGDQPCKNSKLCGIDTGDGTSPGYLPKRSGSAHLTIPTSAHTATAMRGRR